MKHFAIIIMCIALYLLYRIAYPKRVDTKKDDKIPDKKPDSVPDVMGKSRFVLSERSKPLQTPATLGKTEKGQEKASIFAPETGKKQSAIIPAEQLDEVFGDNPEIMSISLEYEEDNDMDFEAEEAEELSRMLGHEPVLADGMDYDNLQTVVKIVQEQPDEVNEETGRTLAALENTDMFEMLVSGDEGKLSWIQAIIERSIQKIIFETENENPDTDYGDFVADFLS